MNPGETASEESGELGRVGAVAGEIRSRKNPEETASEGSGELGRECRPLRISIMAPLGALRTAPGGLFEWRDIAASPEFAGFDLDLPG